MYKLFVKLNTYLQIKEKENKISNSAVIAKLFSFVTLLPPATSW